MRYHEDLLNRSQSRPIGGTSKCGGSTKVPSLTANGIQLASKMILNQDKRVQEHSTPQPWFATNAKSRTTVTRSAVLWIEVWNAIQLPPDAPDWSSEE